MAPRFGRCTMSAMLTIATTGVINQAPTTNPIFTLLAAHEGGGYNGFDRADNVVFLG